jgi:hypothetical protein
LSQEALDVVDLYHFGVSRTSDVRLVLDRSAGATLTLVRDSGERIGSGRSFGDRSVRDGTSSLSEERERRPVTGPPFSCGRSRGRR